MALKCDPVMTEDEARQASPLRLAYVGDTVWELLVRLRAMSEGKNIRHMHQEAVAQVNAAAQAQALQRIEPMLTEAELDITRRGRNAHARHPVPKHQEQADYQAATALEALMGYLYLIGRAERLEQLFAAAEKTQEDASCPPQS